MQSGGTLAVRPLSAPVSPSRILSAASTDGSLEAQQQAEVTNALILQAIAAMNERIDRIVVVNDATETVVLGTRALNVRNNSVP